ncbi:MAG: WD40/YVTN/BNR-like repeat-containing protein, partial [Candidatus Kapaibacteriota bacterium]
MKSNNIFNRRGKLYPFGAVLIIGLFIFGTILEAKNFDLTPLRNGFFGSVIIDSTIIVYGDYGVIYRSTDLGGTWKMHLIGEDANIRRIENFNDTLWGILEKGKIIRSTNKGETWEFFDINIPQKEGFYWLLIDSNYLYVRCDSSILKLDRNLKLLKSITNEFLKIRWNDFYSDCTLLSPVMLPIPIKFYFVFDKIIVPISSSEVSLVESFCVIDKELNNLNLVTISDKIPKQKGENYLALVDIFYFDNTYTFQFIPRYGLFKTDSTFKNWQWFFKDPSFLNYTFEVPTLRWENYYRVGSTSLFTDNTTLYGIYNKEEKHIIDSKTGAYTFLFNNIYVEEYKSKPKDTFIVIGNPFKDIYLATFEYN